MDLDRVVVEVEQTVNGDFAEKGHSLAILFGACCRGRRCVWAERRRTTMEASRRANKEMYPPGTPGPARGPTVAPSRSGSRFALTRKAPSVELRSFVNAGIRVREPAGELGVVDHAVESGSADPVGKAGLAGGTV